MLVLHSRDCQGLDPRVIAQMVEPTFTDADLLIVINTVDDAAPLEVEQIEHAVPQVSQEQPAPLAAPADLQSVAPDLQALIAARKYGQPVPSGVEVAEQMACGVPVPDDVQALARDLGLVIVPSARGVEARTSSGAMSFAEHSMDRMHATLLLMRTRELQRLLG